jgi:hypothetical protein
MATPVIGTSISAAQLKDLFRQIDEGSITGAIVQAVLEHRNPFTNFVSPDEVKTTLTITVRTIQEMISAGEYDSVNGNVVKNFSFDPLAIGEWEFRLIDPQGNISSDKAKTLCEEGGWQAAALEHLLAFGAMFPNAQKENPVIALVSVCQLGGVRHVPVLWGDGVRRKLDLDWWSDAWSPSVRFLSVRKV